MKKIIVISLLLCVAALAFAQATSRNVTLTWTAPSTAPTGYNVYACTVASGGTSCIPNVAGTPINASLLTATTLTVQESVGAAYGFSVVAVYPACTSSSSLTAPCGMSAPATISYVPVPPQGTGASNIIIVVQ